MLFQIAIFKLELDPRLSSVFVHHLIPRVDLVLNILKNLSESFQNFCKVFYSLNENIQKSFLLNSPIMRRGNRDNKLIDPPYFSQNIPPLT